MIVTSWTLWCGIVGSYFKTNFSKNLKIFLETGRKRGFRPLFIIRTPDAYYLGPRPLSVNVLFIRDWRRIALTSFFSGQLFVLGSCLFQRCLFPLFLLGFPFDCLFILLFLSDVLFVVKKVTYQMMMDWSSSSRSSLEHVVLFISSGGSLSDDVIDYVTSITHSNSVFDYPA